MRTNPVHLGFEVVSYAVSQDFVPLSEMRTPF